MLVRPVKQQLAPKRDNPIAYFDWHWLGRNRTTFALLLTLLSALLAFGSGLAHSTDEQLRVVRESILNRPASGDIHILEIDAKSIAALNSWPWPRGIHGQIVDQLSRAGVDTIAFDVDFSSPSVAEQDRLFADALQRFDGTIVLPTFVQKSAAGDAILVENLPIEPLRANAFLASVNVEPDYDGAIRNIGYGTVTEGVVRPTMAAVLANATGDIGRQFRVDTSIDPSTLPRHSVIDLLSDKIPAGSLKGKSVFIGATAIELGDRYAMPRHGVQPGVVIQALAAETLKSRDDFGVIGQWLSIAIAFFAALWTIRRRHLRGVLTAGSAGLLLLLLLPLVLEYLSVATIDIATALYAQLATIAVCTTAHVLGRFNHLRLVDADTGFPNERAMAHDFTNGVASFVVVMQIENFSDVAAVLEEHEQTILLQNIGQGLRFGSGDQVIYRLGKGSLGWLSPVKNITELAESIDGAHAVLRSRIAVGSNKVNVSACFGIAPASELRNSGDIGNASLAAHQAQLSGMRWTVFNDAMSDRNGYVQHVLSGLDDAIERDDIYLLYQPKFSLRDDRITGVEALVRWDHAALGPISPAEFIPVLEQNNLMAHLTLHIAKKCGELAVAWYASGRDTSIAINISAPLLNDNHFTQSLRRHVQTLGEARYLITFEITESAAVIDDSKIIVSLNEFRQLGIQISIDDYGTGQSTLSYLQKFPADEVKIDQSFVRNLLHNKSDQILVRSTIELGHELGLKVIAEGVEDPETMALLKTYGCDAIQGWHIGRPVAAVEIEQQLNRYHNDVATKAVSAY